MNNHEADGEKSESTKKGDEEPLAQLISGSVLMRVRSCFSSLIAFSSVSSTCSRLLDSCPKNKRIHDVLKLQVLPGLKTLGSTTIITPHSVRNCLMSA